MMDVGSWLLAHGVLSWYALALVGIVLLLLTTHGIRRLAGLDWATWTTPLFAHLIYPHFSYRVAYFGAATRLGLLGRVGYLAVNTLCMAVGEQSQAAYRTRTATAALINTSLLFCSPSRTMIPAILGISQRTHQTCHKWAGVLAISQALIHTTLALMQLAGIPWRLLHISGATAGVACSLLGLSSVSLVRRWFFECFLRIHLLLAAVVLAALWLHVQTDFSRLLLSAASAVWALASLAQGLMLLLRNWSRGQPSSQALITPVQGVLKLAVSVPRGWQVRAGQYVYLRFRGMGLSAALQSHPFMIVWWDDRTSDRDQVVLYLVVEPRNGLTRDLMRRTRETLPVIVDGPHGVTRDLGQYGTVVMFATGIGIVGHILYLRDLLQGARDLAIRSRRIVLVWEVQDANCLDWVREWIDVLLKVDKDLDIFILSFSLYVPTDAKLEERSAEHGRVAVHYETPNIAAILHAEARRPGWLLVSVCAHHDMSDAIRRWVCQNMDARIRLEMLDFQPSSPWHPPGRVLSPSHPSMDFACRGGRKSGV